MLPYEFYDLLVWNKPPPKFDLDLCYNCCRSIHLTSEGCCGGAWFDCCGKGVELDPNCWDYHSSYRIVEPRHKPFNYFQEVLNRIQGVWCKACTKFDASYIHKLRDKLDGDYSLKNIHKNLPNKDQPYLNYIYYRLTDKQLYINVDHQQFLKMKIDACYRKYRTDFAGKRPSVLNIISVVIDTFPALCYIKPFIYTKFNLSIDIYNTLQDVCRST